MQFFVFYNKLTLYLHCKNIGTDTKHGFGAKVCPYISSMARKTVDV
jgi:hypothetical protein